MLAARTTTLLFLALPMLARAQNPARAVQLVPSELAGVVRDTANNPLRDVEILIPALGKSARTDDAGKFALVGIMPGVNEVWFRHIGYTSVQFDWPAVEGQRTELAVALHRLPNTLDPVIVWANESRTLAFTSTITGMVIDSNGAAVPNADVRLIGADRATVSGDDGTFSFRHVPPGVLTIRARHLGYSPVTLTTELRDDDRRQVALQMRHLDHVLDTVKVTEESGYGVSDAAWRELELRNKWRSNSGGALLIGPQRLQEAGGMPLNMLMSGYGAMPQPFLARTRRNQDPDLCVLENGIVGRWIPLSIYKASEVDRIEYYPATTSPGRDREYTGTVEARLSGVGISAEHKWGCGRTPTGGHPAYYVVWLKSAR